MPAANTDKLKKLSKRWVGQIGAAGVSDNVTTTIPLSSVTNLATDTAVLVTVDRVDANGVATPALEESVIGVVSGSNLINCVRGTDGTAQAHNAGAVVEVLVSAKGYNDIIDHLLVEHSQLGVHSKINGNTVPSGTDTVVMKTTTDTLTNKRITKRALALSAGSATPAINTDSYDVVHITAQNAAITSFTTNLTGTPVEGDTLRIDITDDGTARALTFGAKFESSGTVSLPTTTVLSVRLEVGFFWNTVTSKWRCVATA